MLFPGRGTSKAVLVEVFACWRHKFFLYQPATNQLLPFSADADGRLPPRDEDNVFAIQSSANDVVAQRLCEME